MARPGPTFTSYVAEIPSFLPSSEENRTFMNNRFEINLFIQEQIE